MILDIPPLGLLLAVLAVALGTAVQATIGFGAAMVAAPLLVLIDRDLVPGPLIATLLVLVLWMAVQERAAVNLGNIKAGVLGRVGGTIPAALLVGTLSAAAFDLIFSLLVIAGVLLSLVHPHVRPTRNTVFLAALASGFMGTISSIGGPPLALVYQHSQGPELRANLAVLFIVGCLISLLALSLIGRFGTRDLGYAAVLSLGVAIGILAASPLKRRLDKHAARPYLLALSLLSAVLVLGRALATMAFSGQ